MKKTITLITLFISSFLSSQTIALDTEYGTNSSTIINSQTTDDATKSVLLSDGSLLISALKYNETTNNHEAVVVKYKTNGDVDDSFGQNGIYTSTIKDDNGLELLIDLDENIYLAGEDYEANKNVVVKLLPTGIIDNTYGDNGEFVVDSEYINIRYYLKDNLLYIGVNYGISSNQYGIIRINSNGNQDFTFGDEGIVNVVNYINEFYVTNDDNFIIVGSDDDFDSVIVSKHSPNGDIDVDFADNGILFTGDDSAEYFKFIEIENNLYMTIGIVGSNIYSEIHKFNTNSLDTSFGNQGIITIPGFYLTYLDLYEENLYALGSNVGDNSINLRINSFNTNGVANVNFSEDGVFIEETDFTQFAVNLHVRDDSFIIVGENNHAEEDIEHFSVKYDLTNATASVNSFEHLNITFQNPIEDILTINSLSENINDLKLLSLDGKILKESNSNIINTSDLTPNLYILNCYLENGDVVSKKIIKQ